VPSTPCHALPFSDPLTALEVVLASRSLPSTLLLGAAVVLGLYTVLGRAFCGWLCPLGLLFEIATAMARTPVFSAWSPIQLLIWGVAFAPGPELAAVGVLLAAEHLAPRAFCRALCPVGALYSLVGRWSPLRVRIDPGAARLACGRCTLRCPMGIRVMEDWTLAGRSSVADPECTRCGACIDACPGAVLALGWRQRKRPAVSQTQG
jgi:ferredoxin-type protein NapH